MYYVISDKMIDLPTGIELCKNSEKQHFFKITPQKIEEKQDIEFRDFRFAVYQ